MAWPTLEVAVEARWAEAEGLETSGAASWWVGASREQGSCWCPRVSSSLAVRPMDAPAVGRQRLQKAEGGTDLPKVTQGAETDVAPSSPPLGPAQRLPGWTQQLVSRWISGLRSR